MSKNKDENIGIMYKKYNTYLNLLKKSKDPIRKIKLKKIIFVLKQNIDIKINEIRNINSALIIKKHLNWLSLLEEELQLYEEILKKTKSRLQTIKIEKKIIILRCDIEAKKMFIRIRQ